MQIKGTPSLLKSVNLGKVERFIRENVLTTKPQIANGTKLSLVTVTKLVNILEAEGRILTSGMEESTGGRPAQYYRMNPKSHYFIGIHYIKGKFICFLIDALGKIVLKRPFHIRSKNADELFDQLCDFIEDLMNSYDGRKAITIGVGIPGVEDDGILTSMPSLIVWEGFPLREKLKSRFNIPVLIENDINLAAIGLYGTEYEDSIDNMVLIYLDEGVGSGIILNGTLFRGKTNFAGELGYMYVQSSLLKDSNNLFHRKTFENIISDIRESMEETHKAIELQEELCNILSMIINNVVCVINPEVIVINSTLLDKNHIRNIKEVISSRIRHTNTPEIFLLSDMQDCYLEGLIKMCVDKANYMPRIS